MSHNLIPCACGARLPMRQLLNHKRNCPHQRAAILADLRRVASALGRTPTWVEYNHRRADGLPCVTNLITEYFLTWNSVICAAGLVPTREPLRRPCVAHSHQSYWWQDERQALREYGYYA